MKKLIYLIAILSFITLPSICFAPPMYYGAVPQDETYSAANFNGDTKRAVSQDDFYDYLHNFDADDDGSFADETWLTGAYQPLEATLTDIADGTISEDLVNTANPWADNEVKGTHNKSFVIYYPTSSDDFLIWRTPDAITITNIHGVLLTGTNVVGGIDECDSNGANAVAVDSDITFNGSLDSDDGTLSNAVIDAGDWIQWHTTSVSAPGFLSVTIYYTIN